jgi:hypothetical protein
MKKVLIAAAAVTALALGAGAGPVSAAPGFNPSKYCNSIGNAGLSHGECTSLVARIVNKSGSDDAAAFCKEFQLFDPTTFDATFKNLGDCVSSFH